MLNNLLVNKNRKKLFNKENVKQPRNVYGV